LNISRHLLELAVSLAYAVGAERPETLPLPIAGCVVAAAEAPLTKNDSICSGSNGLLTPAGNGFRKRVLNEAQRHVLCVELDTIFTI